jgi:uncharacterized protein (DUF362 family)/Ni,Fe-hydrogenase III small subunit
MELTASLAKYTSSPDSLRAALHQCQGLEALDPDHHVLIKPNLVAWDDQFPMAPYGVYTTTRLVEDMVIILKDHGCSRISIGEGSVEIKKGVGTMRAFKELGYFDIQKRYGVDLVDFNESKAEKFSFNEKEKLHIAEEAINTDFFINFPVLKTHGQTKVSLGLKNLKGCLKLASKKLCHHRELHLEYAFSFIADFIKPSLTIVDGIYALEKGALHYGNAYRKDIIVASTDPLAADIVAARTIGYDAGDIPHFVHYAERNGRSLAIDDYRITGEKLEDHVQPLKWDWRWTDDNTGPGIFQKMGITGVALPKYDDTLCSGCSPIANMVNILVLSAFKGEPLPKIEILNGKKMQARSGYDKTIMLGNCIIKANKGNANIEEPIEVTGCPPKMDELVDTLRSAGLDVNELAYIGYQKQQSEKYNGKDGYDPGLYLAG